MGMGVGCPCCGGGGGVTTDVGMAVLLGEEVEVYGGLVELREEWGVVGFSVSHLSEMVRGLRPVSVGVASRLGYECVGRLWRKRRGCDVEGLLSSMPGSCGEGDEGGGDDG